MPGSSWPEIRLADWVGTRDALHLWTQVVGKVRLGLVPAMNHWWHVSLYVTSRGLTTGLMDAGGRGLDIELDLVDSLLRLRTSDGEERLVPLEPQSVAHFHQVTMAALAELGVAVRIVPRPVEVAKAIPFPDDVEVRPYDAAAAQRFGQALRDAQQVMTRFRGGFVGKASPVHFFWGGNDLAVTRFSGRTAPRHPGGIPNCPDWVMEQAYSHEVSSCGFWPDGSAEGVFYSYAYPEPPGFRDWPIEPAGAYYDRAAGEFVLPYTVVRTAADPDATLLAFFESSYGAAADLAGWDRTALELA